MMCAALTDMASANLGMICIDLKRPLHPQELPLRSDKADRLLSAQVARRPSTNKRYNSVRLTGHSRKPPGGEEAIEPAFAAFHQPGQDVRQQVTHKDATFWRTHTTGGLDKIQLFDLQNLAAKDPRWCRPRKQRNHHNHDPNPWSQHHHQQQAQKKGGHADHQIDKTHDEKVSLAAYKTSDAADQQR